MKAFVIKNKEGKYYQSCYNQSPFTDDLFNANKYQYKEEAEKLLNNSFTLVDTLEVVEITIAEGDLEHENKQLKEQLAEKDKEIEQLKKNMEFDTAYYIKELVNVRKQVCEEIRELETRYRYDDEKVIEGYFIDKEKLNQIEKEEQAKESIDEDRN